MTLPKTKTYINCEDCGKLIEMKGRRTRCIKCSNIRDKKIAEERRQTEENKEYMKKWHKENRR